MTLCRNLRLLVKAALAAAVIAAFVPAQALACGSYPVTSANDAMVSFLTNPPKLSLVGSTAVQASQAGTLIYSGPSNRLMLCDGTSWKALVSGAAGSNTQIQFNAGGVITADAEFVYDAANNAMGIGTASIAASAAVDVVSTQRGFVPPRLTTAQRDAITSPAEGLLIYNMTTKRPEIYDGTSWLGMGTPTLITNPLAGIYGLSAPVAAGMFAYFPMDGSGMIEGDSYGLYNLSLSNGPTSPAGKYGGTRCFNGSNQYGTFAQTIYANQTTPISYSFWYKGTGNRGPIMGWDSGGIYSQFGLTSGGRPIYIHHNGAWLYDKLADVDVMDDQWHHIVYVRRANETIDIYVDGVKRLNNVSAPTNHANAVTITRLMYGYDIGSHGNYASGCMDEVGFWSRPLVDAEVAYLYNGGSGRFLRESGTAGSDLYAFDAHIFTNCGNTGREGPSLTQCRAAYSPANNWDEDPQFFGMSMQGYQTWTVPKTGTYRIVAAGAAGGIAYSSAYARANGAVLQGDFNLTAGEKIRILVGQMGGDGVNSTNQYSLSGGGGGSFVLRGTTGTSEPLIIAGGAGGAPSSAYGTSCNPRNPASGQGQLTITAGSYSCYASAAGKSDGLGGIIASGSYPASAGGGLNGAGSNGGSWNTQSYGGSAILTGGVGGLGDTGGAGPYGHGGFGGGGGGQLAGGGGGGGYTGGNAGGYWSGYADYGTGGSSLNNGANPVAIGASNSSHGYVAIGLVGGAGIDETPNAFSFTDNTNPIWGYVTTSNTITISGLGAFGAPVSVSGDGNPQISINGGAWATSGFIANGQTLAVRLTSALTASTTRSATVSVGTVSDQWDVTTSTTDPGLYTFTSHTFTNCGITGYTGPTLANCRTAYTTAGNWDEDNNFFTMVTQGYQQWTVPKTGTYRVLAAGAAGGKQSDSTLPVANGALVGGDFYFTAGQQIRIVVGQMGSGYTASGYNIAGGGGGSFVVNGTSGTANPLLIAGGGGGAPSSVNGLLCTPRNQNAAHGQAGSSTVAYSCYASTPGKSDGLGGTVASGSYPGSGGGGLNGVGSNGGSWNSQSYGGNGFNTNALGGTHTSYNGNGGFGGGGGGQLGNGGGGGGYTGGNSGGYWSSYSDYGTGGSSYNAGNNTFGVTGANNSHGYVMIGFTGAGGIDLTPDAFDFSNITNAAWNSNVQSAALTINGLSTFGAPVTITGDGTPQFRIAGGDWTTSGNIFNGQTLEIRTKTANAASTANNVTVTVGDASDAWTVTTGASDSFVYNFSTHTFTNCGATGPTGPTLANCRTAYTTSGNWDEDPNYLNMTQQGYQIWTVPQTGTYRIRAAGAAGGIAYSSAYARANGAVLQGDFDLVAGEQIRIVVGQMGGDGVNSTNQYSLSGGGGGSFVMRGTTGTSNPLIIAGGAGGAPSSAYGTSCNPRNPASGQGQLSTSTATYSCYATAAGKSDGLGGVVASGSYPASAGGGLNGNGVHGAVWNTQSYGGAGFIYGAVGGTGDTGGAGPYGHGGFGGGGGGQLAGGGGGGGYTGGNAGGYWSGYADYGGGGSSLNNGLNTMAIGATNASHGYVLIGRVGAGGLDETPNAFAFTDINDAVWGMQYMSNTVTINGMDPFGARVTTNGDIAEISINGGAWATTGHIYNGQTLAVRMFAPGSDNGVASVTVTVGGTSDTWTISTDGTDPTLYDFTEHTFTPCGASGPNGPTQAACRAAYNPTNNWDENNAYYLVPTQGYQLWTVPKTGAYRITAAGAVGGVQTDSSLPAGRGAIIRGDFNLIAGQQLRMVVGQMGQGYSTSGYNIAGGGGGSFVVRGATGTSDPLIIAGGGGGAPASANGTSCTRNFGYGSGQVGIRNAPFECYSGVAATENGLGGAVASGSYPGSAGGGLNGAGGNGGSWNSQSYGGAGFNTTAVGGTHATHNGNGGFGGGGGGQLGGPGGGGGYTGGHSGGYWSSYSDYGGGGSSYNAGLYPFGVSALDGNNNDGYIKIEYSPCADFNWSKVSLRLAMDGTDGSTTFDDGSNNTFTVTAVGNAAISTAQSKSGGASAAFDGTGDRLTVPAHAALNMGTGDFTLEFWVRPASLTGQPTLFVMGNATTGLIYTIKDNKPYIYFAGTEGIGVGATSFSVNTWHHVAVSRWGGKLYTFLDGVQQTSNVNGSSLTAATGIVIGGTVYDDFSGHIDDLRLTKGAANYTQDYTPPAARLPICTAGGGGGPVLTGITNFGTYRAWEDSSLAINCKAYRSPTTPYSYSGDTGSGVYRVDPDGAGGNAPFDVYCDMNTGGGGWTAIVSAQNLAVNGTIHGNFAKSGSGTVSNNKMYAWYNGSFYNDWYVTIPTNYIFTHTDMRDVSTWTNDGYCGYHNLYMSCNSTNYWWGYSAYDSSSQTLVNGSGMVDGVISGSYSTPQCSSTAGKFLFFRQCTAGSVGEIYVR